MIIIEKKIEDRKETEKLGEIVINSRDYRLPFRLL